MIRTALIIAASTLVLCLVPRPSHAQNFGNAPWCAVTDRGSGEVVWDCQFRTFDECVPNVLAGNRGFCNVNPYYVGPAVTTPNSRRRRS